MARDLSAFVGQDHDSRLVVKWLTAAVANGVPGVHAAVIGISGFVLQRRPAWCSV
jgi:hypothetical protein